ncbi:MAG: AEC family transporter [Haloferacaceae archaeon]
MSLAGILATAVLPVVGLAAVGAALGRYAAVDPEPLTTVVVYVLAPALVFHSLATTAVGAGTVLRVAVGVAAVAVAVGAVAAAVGRLRGHDDALVGALVLVTAFGNTGNYGLPLSAFAFGGVGRSTAVVYLVAQSVLLFSAGVYLAAWSGGSRGGAGARRVLELPLIYAVGAALAARRFGLVPPPGTDLMATVRLVGDAAVPVMLLVLGLQLERADIAASLGRVAEPTVLRMAVAPPVAVGVAAALGLDPPGVARTFVLQSSMPTAVFPLVLLTEFAGDATVDGTPLPQYAGAVVLVTTLVSVPALTALIAVLRSGAVV